MQCTNVSIILDTSASLAVRSFFFFLVVERISVRSVVRCFNACDGVSCVFGLALGFAGSTAGQQRLDYGCIEEI